METAVYTLIFLAACKRKNRMNGPNKVDKAHSAELSVSKRTLNKKLKKEFGNQYGPMCVKLNRLNILIHK